jgi:hypothetical protein
VGVRRMKQVQNTPKGYKPQKSLGAWGRLGEGCHLSGTRAGFQQGPGCGSRPLHRLPFELDG